MLARTAKQPIFALQHVAGSEHGNAAVAARTERLSNKFWEGKRAANRLKEMLPVAEADKSELASAADISQTNTNTADAVQGARWLKRWQRQAIRSRPVVLLIARTIKSPGDPRYWRQRRRAARRRDRTRFRWTPRGATAGIPPIRRSSFEPRLVVDPSSHFGRPTPIRLVIRSMLTVINGS